MTACVLEYSTVGQWRFWALHVHPGAHLPHCHVCLSALVGRYELERGPGHIKLTTRLALSPFGNTSAAELAAAAEAALEASRQAVLGPEAAAAGGVLDAVLLHWLDYEVCCRQDTCCGSQGALGSGASKALSQSRPHSGFACQMSYMTPTHKVPPCLHKTTRVALVGTASRTRLSLCLPPHVLLLHRTWRRLWLCCWR